MILLYTLATVCIVQCLVIIFLLLRLSKIERRIRSLFSYVTELFNRVNSDDRD